MSKTSRNAGLSLGLMTNADLSRGRIHPARTADTSAVDKRRQEARARAAALAEAMTDDEDAALTAAALADPDNQPVPDDARLVPARHQRNRPGRPRVPNPKVQITLRLDPDVIEHFRAMGDGWQSQINEALRKAIKAA